MIEHPPLSTTTIPRQWDLDALRGLALGGILVVNIQWFSSAYQWRGLPEPSHHGQWDMVCRWLITFFFEGKFYPLFSFLFGYSLVLQLGMGETTTSVFRAKRRQWALLALGLVHGVLLFPGDVLLTYGLLGALLLRWRSWTVQRRLKAAFALWLLLVLLFGLMVLATQASNFSLSSREVDAAVAQANAAQQILQRGGWPMHQQRLKDWIDALLYILIFHAPSTLMWLLLGSAMAKAGGLGPRLSALPTRWGFLLCGLGGVGAWFYAQGQVAGNWPSQIQGLWALVTLGPALSACYLWLMVRSCSHPAAQRWLQPLTQAGRMSLTLYLSQSLICAMLFTGYGLGWVGQLTLIQTLSLALCIYAAQVWMAKWWLAHYAAGPVEAVMQRWLNRPLASP